MEIGFVGTGNMGRPMAANLLKAGHAVVVFDRDPQAMAPLVARGARAAADLPALAASVRVTLLSLPDAAAVEAVVLGAAGRPGLLDGARAGDVVFDLSTVDPASTRRLAARAKARGVAHIDAPVSGSVSGAEAGTLAVMVGAPEGVAGAYDTVFRAIGQSIFYLGEVGTGNILKLLNNYCALTNQAALCEALALADRLGVGRDVVADVLQRSSGASFILERKRRALVERDYRAGFFVDLAWKDLRLVLELAEEAGAATAVGREAWGLYSRARQAGLGALDSAGLLRLLEPPPAGASPTR